MDHLLGRTEVFAAAKDKSDLASQLPSLDTNQRVAVAHLSRLPAFNGIVAAIRSNSDFTAWLGLDNPELSVPILWADDTKCSKFDFCLPVADVF